MTDQSEHLSKQDDDWVYELSGSYINRFTIDYAFTFEIHLDLFTLTFRIENDFYCTSEGKTTLIKYEDMESLAKLHPALHQEVNSITITPGSEATMILKNPDMKIVVSPHEQYEAWTISDSNSHLFVCVPGGGIAAWTQNPQDTSGT